jgi:hypothetical protein
MFYISAVRGTHRALTEMGIIAAEAEGTPAEQVRAIVAPAAEAEAVVDAPEPRRKPGG